MKLASHVWRFLRLFGVGVGHASWVAALNLPSQDKVAVGLAALAATETAYRTVFPSGKIGQLVKDALAAYQVVKQMQAAVAGKPPAA